MKIIAFLLCIVLVFFLFFSVIGVYLMFKNDVYYAQHCTFWMDVKIFFKTITTVFKRENTFKDVTQETEAQAEVERLRAELACGSEVDSNEGD